MVNPEFSIAAVPTPRSPPRPGNDVDRIAALRRYRLFQRGMQDLTDTVRQVSETFAVPACAITVIGKYFQAIKASVGMDLVLTHRDDAFCAYTILNDEAFVIEDALNDDRFAQNPLVLGPPGIRFYAGAPLRLPDGHKIGALCLIDTQARRMSVADRDGLLRTAGEVERTLAKSTLQLPPRS